jgi:hypothetical protein
MIVQFKYLYEKMGNFRIKQYIIIKTAIDMKVVGKTICRMGKENNLLLMRKQKNYI